MKLFWGFIFIELFYHFSANESTTDKDTEISKSIRTSNVTTNGRQMPTESTKVPAGTVAITTTSKPASQTTQKTVPVDKNENIDSSTSSTTSSTVSTATSQHATSKDNQSLSTAPVTTTKAATTHTKNPSTLSTPPSTVSTATSQHATSKNSQSLSTAPIHSIKHVHSSTSPLTGAGSTAVSTRTNSEHTVLKATTAGTTQTSLLTDQSKTPQQQFSSSLSESEKTSKTSIPPSTTLYQDAGTTPEEQQVHNKICEERKLSRCNITHEENMKGYIVQFWISEKEMQDYQKNFGKSSEPTAPNSLVIILASVGALLVTFAVFIIYFICHRRSYGMNQQHLTEELHTTENGYHDNPTLEVMEVQPEMQEKKAALTRDFNDSWIVPIDNLGKEDMPEEEDTHL